MIQKKNVIALIPARGGSKSIPHKNIKLFAGKPLIAWSILAAHESRYVSRVFVSTDDAKIARVAKKYGAEIIPRPDALAGDRVPTEPVVRHAIEYLKTENYPIDAVVLLMPPTPSRQPRHIDAAINLFFKKNVDSVISVNETPANHTPYWTLVRSKTGKVTLFGGKSIKNILPQRQSFPQKCYGRNDLLYVIKPANLFQKKMNLYGNKIELLETEPEFEMDINSPDEWSDAEIKFKRLLKS